MIKILKHKPVPHFILILIPYVRISKVELVHQRILVFLRLLRNIRRLLSREVTEICIPFGSV